MCRGIFCIVLTVFNVALLLAGLAMLIGGALLKWNKQLLQTIIEKALEKSGGSMSGQSKETVDLALAKIQEMSGPIGNVLFIFGIVLICVAGLAFVGLCCHIRLAMIIYAVLVGVILAAHATVVIIYFAKREILMKYVEKGFVELMKNYQSIASGTPDSIALGLVMPALQCCGYNNARDFLEPGSKFTKEDTVEGQTIQNLDFPLPCCKPKSTGPGQDQCPKKFDADTSYIQVGCKEEIIVVIDKIMKYSIIAIAVEAALMAVVIIYLCCSK